MIIKLGDDCYARSEDILYFVADYDMESVDFTFKNGAKLTVGVNRYDPHDGDDDSYIDHYMEAIADLINDKAWNKMLTL